MKIRWNKKHQILLLLALFSPASQAMPTVCQVVDPELVGTYEGACESGLAEGQGAAKGSAIYEGEFRAGKKHGRGRKTWASGDSYEGQFADDRRDGVGIYRWGGASPWAGDFYWGGFRADRRDGRGLYGWANGDRFDGEWKADVRQGFSAMELQRGRAREAWMSSVGRVGATVCSERPVGGERRFAIRGDIVKIDGDMIDVRLVGMRSDSVENPDGSSKIGAVLKESYYEWFPCTPSEG